MRDGAPPANARIKASDPTRDAAFDLLAAVLDRRRPLEEALDALPAMEPRDRAAAHRLAATVLRRAGTLDAVLEPFLTKAPPAPVRHVLRIGAAGLLLLGTPAHAAVATAVALARARGLAPFAGLVNAVLRRVGEAGPAALAELDGPRLDTPGWLWSAWGSGRARHRDRASERGAARSHPAPRRVRAGGRRDAAHRLGPLPGRNPRRGAPGLSTAENSGCRTPPPRCRPGCSRRGRGSGSPISAPRQAARPRSSPRPARG